MDSSLFIQQKHTDRKWTEAAYLAAAVFLAGSCFSLLTGMLHLSWSPADLFRGGPVSGLVSAWNHARDTLGTSGFILIKRFAGTDNGYGFFLTLTLLVMCLLAWLIVRSLAVPMLLVFVVPAVILGLLFGLTADARRVVVFAAAVMAALVVMRMDGGGLQAAAVAVLLIGLMAVLFAAAQSGRVRVSAGQGSGTTLSRALANRFYGTDPLGHGDLTRTVRNEGEGDPEKTALEVTMSEPQEMYLRGFVGSRYSGNRWSSLTNAAYYQAEDVMEALRAERFNAPGQLAQAAELAGSDPDSNEVTVRNTGADRRYAYVPYEITDRGTLQKRLLKGGSEFYHGVLGSFRTESFTASENQTSVWTDVAGSLFTGALGGEDDELSDEEETLADDAYDDEDDMDDEYDAEDDEDTDDAEEEDDEEEELTDEARAAAIADYLRLESHYNAFVYQNDTYLTAHDRMLLAKNIGTAGDQTGGHLDYKVAINSVRSFLEDQFIYSDNLGAFEDGQNALETFFETHRGYDIHFATAATLMFRYYGIPARYVEGYLVTGEDAAEADEETPVAVSRAWAHAWTEIYLDGVGFVPLEVTPEFYGVMDEADLNIGISNESLVQQFRDAYGNSGSQNEAEDEDPDQMEEESAGTVMHVLHLILLVLLLAAAAAALFWLLRRLLRILFAYLARRKLFYREEPKKSVAAIYGYMEEKHYPVHAYAAMLGNRAAYSMDDITEEERGTMLDIYEKARKEAGKQGVRRQARQRSMRTRRKRPETGRERRRQS